MHYLHQLPTTRPTTCFMGNIFMQLGNQDSAFHYIDKAQKLDPENGMTYLTKAQIYYMDGDSINYDKQIYQALVSKDLDVNNKVAVLTDYIKQLLAERDSSQRIDNLFSVLIRNILTKARYTTCTANIRNKRRIYESGRAACLCDRYRSRQSKCLEELVMLYLMSEDFPQAVTAAQKALNTIPTTWIYTNT